MINDYYVVFLKRNSWLPLSWLIQKIEKKNFSHVEIMQIDKNVDAINHASFYGAVMPKSRKANYREISKHYDIAKCISLNIKVSEEECQTILDKNLNVEYGYVQLLKVFFKICFGVLLFEKHPSKHAICTEYVGNFMKEACLIDWVVPTDLLTLDNIEDEVLKERMPDDIW